MSTNWFDNLQSFLRVHQWAWKFACKAHEDYLLCRLGLLHGLWSALEMSTQAIEKLLKSYLLFSDNSLNGDPTTLLKVVSNTAKQRGRQREFGHDVETCLSLAILKGLSVSNTTQDAIKKVNELYGLRYPDSGGPESLSNYIIKEIDTAIFEIWDRFRDFNNDYYYVSGILKPAYVYFTNQSGYTAANFLILTQDNVAYSDRKSDIESEIQIRISLKKGR